MGECDEMCWQEAMTSSINKQHVVCTIYSRMNYTFADSCQLV